ncbi:MAG: type II toxin-antitoxin system VapC family toxin, partial [Nanoarchaeota archaeon]
MIYLDANIFIYAVLDNKEKGQFCKKLLEQVGIGKINAGTSVLTWDEVIHSLKKHAPLKEVIDQSREFLRFPNLVFLDADQ